MSCVDRAGNTVSGNETQDKLLHFLYQTRFGGFVLPVLIKPQISVLAGKYLDSPLSKWLIKPFVKRNNIDLSEYEKKKYRSYNEFFSRRIKKECRPIDRENAHLIAPCDSKLTVCPIRADAHFKIKNTEYTMQSLVRSGRLAKRYEGGLLFVFRLTVDDYHRYSYVDDGVKSANYRIPGVLHTVNPLANDYHPIYKENTREFSVLKSRNFGNILMMEVGALLVGRIRNHHGKKTVMRGEEKGKFEFGGSTVILAFEPGRVRIDADIMEHSGQGIETAVKLGEKIGERVWEGRVNEQK